MNILLIQGGWSSEREVSLSGGREIETALRSLGHRVTVYDPAHSLDGLLQAAGQADFAFLALHGSPGEDGLIQAMLERAGCPYQGSRPAGSFLALNKSAAKEIFRREGLPTADWAFLPRRPATGWQPPFAYPVFIKSNTGGSSLGMERIARPEDMEAALDRLFALGGEYIVEPCISGVEVTCGVLDTPDGHTQPLPPILIRPRLMTGDDAFFDYASKYQQDGAEEICPAPLPEATTAAVQAATLQAHRCLGLCDYSRADFILREDGSFALLEVNTLPGMTSTSLIPREARAVGLTFEQLIERLIALGSRKKDTSPCRQ